MTIYNSVTKLLVILLVTNISNSIFANNNELRTHSMVMRELKERATHQAPKAQFSEANISLSEEIAKNMARRKGIPWEDFLINELKRYADNETIGTGEYLKLWDALVKQEKTYPSFYAFYHAQSGKAMFFNDVIRLLQQSLDLAPTSSAMRLEKSSSRYQTAKEWANAGFNMNIGDRMPYTNNYFLSATLGLIGDDIFYNENPIYYLNKNTNMNVDVSFFKNKFVNLLQSLGFSDDSAINIAEDFLSLFDKHASEFKGVLRQIFIDQDYIDDLAYLAFPGEGAGRPIFKGSLKELLAELKQNPDLLALAKKMPTDFSDGIVKNFDYENYFNSYNFQVRLYVTQPLFSHPSIVHTVTHLAPGSNQEAYERYQIELYEKVAQLLDKYIYEVKETAYTPLKRLQKYREKRPGGLEDIGFERRLIELTAITKEVIKAKPEPMSKYIGAVKLALLELVSLLQPQLKVNQDSPEKEDILRHLYRLTFELADLSAGYYEIELYSKPPRIILETFNNIISTLYYLTDYIIRTPSIDKESNSVYESIYDIKSTLSQINMGNKINLEHLQKILKKLNKLPLLLK